MKSLIFLSYVPLKSSKQIQVLHSQLSDILGAFSLVEAINNSDSTEWSATQEVIAWVILNPKSAQREDDYFLNCNS